MPKLFESEQAMARELVEHLRGHGWEVFEEVQPGQGSPAADIVATKDGLVWAIECKMTLGLDVIAQAEHWLDYANMVSVATPYKKRGLAYRGTDLAERVLRWRGIGWLAVMKIPEPWVARYCGGEPKTTAREWIEPKRRSDLAYLGLVNAISEFHKGYAQAGCQAGRLTPFKVTGLRVLEVVKARPGIALSELVDAVAHHYGSKRTARASFPANVNSGLWPGMRVEHIEGKACFYPVEDAE